MKFGAIEAGGTKFICSVGNENNEIEIQRRIETTNPIETLDKVIEFFKEYEKNNSNISGIGIGLFGPVEVNESSENYGCILNTPKIAWKNFNVKKYLEKELIMPLFFETDVNVACYGEYKKSFTGKNIIYVTVGTGVGAGTIINKKILSGLHHPEMGHIIIQRRENDDFVSVCNFHKDCLEGLISGPALEKRTGKIGNKIDINDPVWDLVGEYLAKALLAYAYILTPDKIILGGGVGILDQVIKNTKKYFDLLNNEYMNISSDIICKATLNNNSGSIGALLFVKGKLLRKS